MLKTIAVRGPTDIQETVLIGTSDGLPVELLEVGNQVATFSQAGGASRD